MRRLLLGLAAVSIVSAIGLSADTARAGYKMEIDQYQWISLGMGLRAEIGANQDFSDGDWGKNFRIDSVRPYISGQVHEYIKFETNFDFSVGTDQGADIQLLDGIAKFEFNNYVNFWGGRFLPPSDRANLSGPYFLNTWAFPLIAQRYPAIFQGRDNGVVGFGQVGGGKFKYAAGLFEGNPDAKSPQFNARVTVNLLDPEPGYYNSSTYFGDKDVLAIGAVVYYQNNGSTDGTGVRKDFTGWNVDLLFEKKLGDLGTPTIDAAFYQYNNGGANTTVGDVDPNRSDGKSYYVTGGWFLPGEYGFGSMKGLIQPHVRYQAFQNDAVSANQSRWDGGVSWYIKEQNAKFVLYYSRETFGGGDYSDGINLGFQLQF